MEYINVIQLLDNKRKGLKKIIDADCPYEALQLISLHIEFMGKILDRLKPTVSAAWAVNRKETTFRNVCTELSAMNKYDYRILQVQLRNGMVHNGCPKENLLLTHTASQTLNATGKIVLNINTMYEDFSSACDELIARLVEYDKEHPADLDTNPKFPRLSVGCISEFS